MEIDRKDCIVLVPNIRKNLPEIEIIEPVKSKAKYY
jgi:hypothetical protein